jgi:hypothetical protein
MDEFMGENGRYLGVGTQKIDHSGGEVDDPAGKAECVRHILADDSDFIRKRSCRMGKETFEEHPEPGVLRGIRYRLPHFFDFRGDFFSEGDLLLHLIGEKSAAEKKYREKRRYKKNGSVQ